MIFVCFYLKQILPGCREAAYDPHQQTAFPCLAAAWMPVRATGPLTFGSPEITVFKGWSAKEMNEIRQTSMALKLL